MADAILALNAGSSSVKFGLYGIGFDGQLSLMVHGEVGGIGTTPQFVAHDAVHVELSQHDWPVGKEPSYDAVLAWLLEWVQAHLGSGILVAVGHRIVHGGRAFTQPVLLTADTVAALDELTPLAPLHQPHSLAPVRTIMTIQPGLRQFGCFDTAFHRTLPAVATRFALPREYEEAGVRRYGFHGLSYEYIAAQLPKTAPHLADRRVIVAHLGSGASLCAMRSGRSEDTTMGFTALDGLVMGTRCGTLDAGVVLYMMQNRKLSAATIEKVLYQQSGLLGVSGLSSDMRVLTASSDIRAREAFDLFVFRIARETAALAGSLGGLDGFIFTAGIGEHSADVRAAVCERLHWLGVRIDELANLRHAGRISTPDSQVEVRVIPTDEEAMIALHTLAVLSASQTRH